MFADAATVVLVDTDMVFVEFVEALTVVLADIDVVFVEFVGWCATWAWFRFSCSLAHSPDAHR